MTVMFWDRQNQPIHDVIEWARLFEDPAYMTVARDEEGGVIVSTIWQGIDLSHSLTPTTDTAMIFETAVFLTDTHDVMREFWHTEAEAIAGHGVLVDQVMPHRLLPGAERLLSAPDVNGVQGPAEGLLP